MRDVDKIIKYRNNSLQLLEDFKLLTSPINIEKLAKKLDIKVLRENFEDDISGKIVYTSGAINDVVITINDDETLFRQNFSLAHEIGHFIYDIDFFKESDKRIDQATFLRSSNTNPIEQRANKFAERLLMPKNLFNEKTNEIKDELFSNHKGKLGVTRIYKIVDRLSQEFQVSKPAVIVRLSSIKKINRHMKNELFDYHKL